MGWMVEKFPYSLTYINVCLPTHRVPAGTQQGQPSSLFTPRGSICLAAQLTARTTGSSTKNASRVPLVH